MRVTWRLVAWGFVALGLIAGSLSDDLDIEPPHEIGGYVVLETEFHAHTRFSDGFLTPLDLPLHARRQQLDAIAVTEHNLVFPARIARWFTGLVGGPIVLVGQEVTSGRSHIIGVGLDSVIDWDQSAAQIIADIHDQGGAAIGAHPVREFWDAFMPVRDQLDAVEVVHPMVYFDREGSDWSWSHMRDFYLQALDDGHALAPIGASDFHALSPLGLCRTLVFSESATEQGIVDAVRAGRTVVYDPDGVAYGAERWVDLLESVDYQPSEADIGYAAAGALDWTGRSLGWCGVVMLVFVGRRRRP